MFRHICQLAAHPADLSRQTSVFGQSCNRVLSRDRGAWNPTTFQHHFTRPWTCPGCRCTHCPAVYGDGWGCL